MMIVVIMMFMKESLKPLIYPQDIPQDIPKISTKISPRYPQETRYPQDIVNGL